MSTAGLFSFRFFGFPILDTRGPHPLLGRGPGRFGFLTEPDLKRKIKNLENPVICLKPNHRVCEKSGIIQQIVVY